MTGLLESTAGRREDDLAALERTPLEDRGLPESTYGALLRAADGWPGWWGLEGPEYLAWLAGHPEADYVVLMGANTYRLMSGFASQGEPGTDPLGALSKVVFSSKAG